MALLRLRLCHDFLKYSSDGNAGTVDSSPMCPKYASAYVMRLGRFNLTIILCTQLILKLQVPLCSSRKHSYLLSITFPILLRKGSSASADGGCMVPRNVRCGRVDVMGSRAPPKLPSALRNRSETLLFPTQSCVFEAGCRVRMTGHTPSPATAIE